MKKILIMCALWVVMVFGLYAYSENLSGAAFIRILQKDDMEQSWQELSARFAQQGIPVAHKNVVKQIRHLPEDQQFKVLIKQMLQYRVENGGETETKTPQELLVSQTGDCSDFAYLWYHQLWQLGKPAQFISMIIDYHGESFMHAIAVTRNEKGDLVVLDTLSLFPRAVKLEEWKNLYNVKFLFSNYGQTTEVLKDDVNFFAI